MAIIAGVLIVGFFAGMQYLKSSNKDNQTAAATGGGPQMMGGGPQQMRSGGGGAPCANGQPKAMLMLGGQQIESCGRPASGSVTAVSGNSVTITVSSGESVTFSVTAETQIIKKGGTGTLSEIVNGDTLLIVPSDDDATQAKYLLINPPQQGTVQ